MKLAPICLFTYNRLQQTKKTVEALQKNFLAAHSELFIFSDGANTAENWDKVQRIRDYLRTVTGFKMVTLIESSVNKGLADSIISGVTQIVSKYGRVIVLEDDLVTSNNFLNYMNATLHKYENNKDIFSISGFMFDFNKDSSFKYDVFFTKRHCSWGWAMWKDRWVEIDWLVKDYDIYLKDRKMRKNMSDIGSDLNRMLRHQMSGKINSWAIRCNYHQAKKQTYTVYPIDSKIVNIGFSEEATHTQQIYNKYKASIKNENIVNFRLPKSVMVHSTYINQFRFKYSLGVTVFYYTLNKLSAFMRLKKVSKSTR